MDTFHYHYHYSFSPPSSTTTAVDSPNVLDALCAAHDHQLDALPDLLDVFAGKRVVNKELTGQLHNPAQQVPVCFALLCGLPCPYADRHYLIARIISIRPCSRCQ